MIKGQSCDVQVQSKGSHAYIAWLHGEALVESAFTQSLIELHFMNAQVWVGRASPMTAPKDAHWD